MGRILLTGFGPFPGVEVNATGVLVPRLARAARRRFASHSVTTAILPTEWVRGPARARAVFEREQPDVILHFGVSDRAAGFVIERRGVNACVMAADGVGAMPASPVLNEIGRRRRRVTLPVSTIVSRLHELGLPAEASDDAGQYLCNAVLYQSLELADRWGWKIVGFVHLPVSLAKAEVEGALTVEQALAGSLAIIEVCLHMRTPEWWPR